METGMCRHYLTFFSTLALHYFPPGIILTCQIVNEMNESGDLYTLCHHHGNGQIHRKMAFSHLFDKKYADCKHNLAE